MNIARQLVHFAQKTFLQNTIPMSVKEIAILALIDQFGLQVAGTHFEWSKSIYQYLIKYNQQAGQSTITGYEVLTNPVQAAFINGCFAHAQDFDDSHQAAQTHPGSVVIPAAIAIGQHLNQNGATVLNAIIIGMECMLRLAHSLCPACIEGGHHTPLTLGPFGAAIAAGLLLDLNEDAMVHALGICGSYSGGLVEYTLSGGSTKRLHTGIGARAGVEAALLAKEGITGPKKIIEGQKGLWSIYGRGKAVPERLFENIGQDYLFSTLLFKPYNCCYLIHPAIEGFLKLCKKHKLQPDDIISVNVGYSEFSVSHAGKIIIPHDPLGAQFSTAFTLALSLVRGKPDMWSYTQQDLTDSSILKLAQKIHVTIDEEAQREFPQKNGCIVEVITSLDKKSLRIKDPKGSPLNLCSLDDIKEKFFNNTLPILQEPCAEKLYQYLLCFEKQENLKNLGILTHKY